MNFGPQTKKGHCEEALMFRAPCTASRASRGFASKPVTALGSRLESRKGRVRADERADIHMIML